MQNIKIQLPEIKYDKSIDLKHFPTTMQAFVFRNWEMINIEKIAEVLNTNIENVMTLAEDMGLQPQKNIEDWLDKGYITIIRSNWHILPYEQLLTLLGWSEEKLAYVLKEDDFFDIKLGNYKHNCHWIKYRELTSEEKTATNKIKEIMQKCIRL